MDIEPVFLILFIKIKTIDFKNKKESMEKILKQYPEMPFANFMSNKAKADFVWEFLEIFKDEFSEIRKAFDGKINVQSAWSVSYKKGDYHVPHNHGSTGYCGILYLDMHKDSPVTSYLQPWNNDRDNSIIYEPEVKEGDLVIVPQHLIHFTRPNEIKFKKRIISFDFKL